MPYEAMTRSRAARTQGFAAKPAAYQDQEALVSSGKPPLSALNEESG